ncbi:MAG TPA: O-antigen ligase family protein [Pyrinomonadaceae bacterium]|nr:O-antigen ligase family protein [Pyrinomonadaceae bacterium]
MKVEQQEKSQAAKVLDAGIIAFLFIFAFAAPNSIAATQTAWLVGLVLWLVRLVIRPRPKVFRTPIDYLLLGFFLLTIVSSILSYEPMVSIGKLRAASLFTIIYLFAENVRSLRIARLLGIALLAACMVNVLFTVGERLVGRAVKVNGVAQNSPLYEAGIRDGDTLLEVDKQKLRDPQQLVEALSKSDQTPVAVFAYRHELEPTFMIPRGSLLPGSTPLQQLGIAGWSRGRDWRATGFYGQFVTYAEVLQLIFALALGAFVSLKVKRSWAGVLLLICLGGLGFALLLTVTRASWFGCLLSSLVILTLGVSRRTLILIGLMSIPLILGGLFVLQQKRNVAFIDQTDQSTTWRETVWREGFHLLVSKPRHLLVGVGMDSIKTHWRAWGMFDNGRIPWGHMHSNLLQIALERGIPALLMWLALILVYARTVFRVIRRGVRLNWPERGLLLGALGGLIGFLASGVVHYNWGDSEVVMVLFMMMGVSLAICRLQAEGVTD